MHKGRKWLSYAAVITGIIVVCFLALAINRGPLAKRFQPYEGEHSIENYCLWCGKEESLSLGDILGIVLIVLLILTIPAGHIALLITLAIQLNRSSKPSESQPVHYCPHCEHQLHKGWEVCPHCGERIAVAQDILQSPGGQN